MLHSQGKALLHAVAGLVAEQGRSLLNAGQTIADIAWTGFFVNGFSVRAQQLAQVLEQLEHRESLAYGYVVHLAEGFKVVCGQCQHVGLNYIFNEGEVAGLAAITVYLYWLPVQNLVNELGYHGSIRSVRVLARTKHVEIAQPNDFLPVHLAKHLLVQFACQLAHGIGRKGFADFGFCFGKSGFIAVHGTGRCIDHSLDARLSRGSQYIDVTIYIDLVCGDGIGYRAWNRTQGSLMANHVHALASAQAGGEIAHIPFHKLIAGIIAKKLNIGSQTGNQAVQYANPLYPVLEQILHQVAPDKASATRDQDGGLGEGALVVRRGVMQAYLLMKAKLVMNQN